MLTSSVLTVKSCELKSHKMPNIVSKTHKLEMSNFAKRTINPHRIMVESSKVKPNPNKEIITLQLGIKFINI